MVSRRVRVPLGNIPDLETSKPTADSWDQVSLARQVQIFVLCINNWLNFLETGPLAPKLSTKTPVRSFQRICLDSELGTMCWRMMAVMMNERASPPLKVGRWKRLRTVQQSCIRMGGTFGGLTNSEKGTVSRKTAEAVLTNSLS